MLGRPLHHPNIRIQHVRPTTLKVALTFTWVITTYNHNQYNTHIHHNILNKWVTNSQLQYSTMLQHMQQPHQLSHFSKHQCSGLTQIKISSHGQAMQPLQPVHIHTQLQQKITF